jgi:hypothetical protein
MLRKLAMLMILLSLSLQGFAVALDCSMPCCPATKTARHYGTPRMAKHGPMEHHHADTGHTPVSVAGNHNDCGSSVSQPQVFIAPQQFDIPSVGPSEAGALFVTIPSRGAIARNAVHRDSGIRDPQSPIPIRI